MHKLLIKTHNKTGLKYLCYTTRKDHVKYKGSGKYWKRHIKEHGYDVSTELIFESEVYENFRIEAIRLSDIYDVVNSKEWANLKIEDGNGGATTSNTKWITDGKKDILIKTTDVLPIGWKFGRTKCVFNNSLKQAEFSKRDTRSHEERSEATKKLWLLGKLIPHTKHLRGEENSSKRSEVKEKMRRSKEKTNLIRHNCQYCNRNFDTSVYHRWHGERCKHKSG